MQRIMAAMPQHVGADGADFDYILVAGHFLARDENIFTFFEGHELRVRLNSVTVPVTTQCCCALSVIARGLHHRLLNKTVAL